MKAGEQPSLRNSDRFLWSQMWNARCGAELGPDQSHVTESWWLMSDTHVNSQMALFAEAFWVKWDMCKREKLFRYCSQKLNFNSTSFFFFLTHQHKSKRSRFQHRRRQNSEVKWNHSRTESEQMTGLLLETRAAPTEIQSFSLSPQSQGENTQTCTDFLFDEGTHSKFCVWHYGKCLQILMFKPQKKTTKTSTQFFCPPHGITLSSSKCKYTVL